MTVTIIDKQFIVKDKEKVEEVKSIASQLFPDIDLSHIDGFVSIQTRDKFNLYIGEKHVASLECYNPEQAELGYHNGNRYSEYYSTNVELNQLLYDLLERYDCHR